MKLLKLIVCCDNELGIGKKNDLPWKNKTEMKLFKNKTIGKENNCVIMGSNTYISIPERYRPLEKRKNIVISSKLKQKEFNDIVVVNSHYEVIDLLKNEEYDEYWLIGGAYVYDFFLKYYKTFIDEIHISILNNSYDCDRFFPKINTHEFSCIHEKVYDEDFTHYVYKNKKYL